MRFETQLQRFEATDIWWNYIDVSNEMAEPFIEGTNRRVICTINEQARFQCALMPIGQGRGWFISVNRKICKKLGLVLGQPVVVDLEKDHSEYGMEMPEELEELLRQDEEGAELFHALTKGKQRSLIHICGNVKSPNIRLRRALVVLQHLKIHGGKVDYKAFQRELKEANQMGL